MLRKIQATRFTNCAGRALAGLLPPVAGISRVTPKHNVQIAFCIFKYFPHGGIQRDLLKLCRECRARGMRVRIYTMHWLEPAGEPQGRRRGHGQAGQVHWHPQQEKTAEIGGLEICLAPVRALSRHRRYERFADSVLKDLSHRPVDLVVGMNKMPGLDVYYAGDSCYQEKAQAQRPFLYRLLPRYRSFLGSEKAVFDPAGRTEILTIAPTQAPVFQRHYRTPRERFHPLPPGIERDRAAPPNRQAERTRMREALGLAEPDRLLLFVGSGFIIKGLERVLRGLSALPPELLNRTRLFVLGDDKTNRFVRMARRLALGERVHFLGGRNDVPDFLLAGDGLVLPALDETAGMVILEAMIAGLPALVTENCGYASHLREAGAGLVTPLPFRQQTFNRQLVELLSSRERKRWSKNGLAVAHNESIYQMASKAVDLLERFAQTPMRPSKAARRAAWQRVEKPAVDTPMAVATKLFVGQNFDGPSSPQQLLAWAESVEGEVHRRAHGRLTKRVLLDRKAYFLKYHSGVGYLEILKNAGLGKRPVLGADNEFHACRYLERRGIAAPRVVAFAATGSDPARRRSLILCEELTGFVSLETIIDQWHTKAPHPQMLGRLVAGVARFVRQLHSAGVVHRDLYICHLWLHTDAWATGEVRLAVIDLHRARRLDPIPDYWRKRDLAALLFSILDAPLHRHARLRFLRIYSGCPLREALTTRSTFWQSVHRRALRLYRKGAGKGLNLREHRVK